VTSELRIHHDVMCVCFEGKSRTVSMENGGIEALGVSSLLLVIFHI
jgi:hypothetical protein